MAEFVAAAIEYIGAALESEMVLTAGEIALISQGIVLVASVYTLREQQRRAEGRAKDAYNASLRDRYTMFRGATEPRQLMLGRCRVSGPMTFVQSYGASRGTLTFVLPLAAHEIDAVEGVYFDDEQVILDGAGNVTGINRRETFSIAAASGTFDVTSTPAAGTVTAIAYYGTTSVALTVTGVAGVSVSVSGALATTGRLVISYQPASNPYKPNVTGTQLEQFVETTGSDAFTLTFTPVSGSVFATEVNGSGQDQVVTSLGITSVVGNVVTISGGAGGSVVCTIVYQAASVANGRARVRSHTGAPGQVADATLISQLPALWTSAHVGNAVAYLVLELDYDPSAFTGGVPNVSAQVRGLKCLDPRSGATAWTENPALLLNAYATHALGGRMAAASVNSASVITAANRCDTATNYVVAGKTYSRALYTAGLSTKAGVRPTDVLNDIALAMDGRWCFIDGQLTVLAGGYSAPVVALDETWLHDGGALELRRDVPLADVINTVTGVFADADQDWKVVQFPRVDAASYIAADGKEYPVELNFSAVTFSGQAQYIATSKLRYSRQSTTLKLTCNMRAFALQVFDVLSVTISRLGYVAQPFEVLETSFSLDGGIELLLKSIDPSIWALDATFNLQASAPVSRLPLWYTIPAIAGLAVAAVSATDSVRQPDGTITGRLRATWTLITDARVTGQGGYIEIKWGLANDAEAKWTTVTVSGSETTAYLTPVNRGGIYAVKARAVSLNAISDWSAHVYVSAGLVLLGTVTTDNIADEAATHSDFAEHADSSVTATITGGNVFALNSVTLASLSWLNNTGAARTVQIEAVAQGYVTKSGGTADAQFLLSWSGATPASSSDLLHFNEANSSSAFPRGFSEVRQVSVANAATLNVSFIGRATSGGVAGNSTTLNYQGSIARLAVLKK